MVCLVGGGVLADEYGYFAVMKVGVAVLAVWSAPAYYLLHAMHVQGDVTSVWPLVVVDVVTVVGLGLFGGPMQLFMVSAIEDVALRYTAIGIAYNVSQGMFGGTAPLVGSALSMVSIVYVGVYLSGFAVVS